MREIVKLDLLGLRSGYGTVSIVNGVTLSIQSGEIFALMGKNGMGKTTLLKSILGLIKPNDGEVSVDGKPINGRSTAELIAAGIGYAPQEQPLFQDLSIRDNLRLALRTDRDLKPALERVFNHFPFLKERMQQKAGTLSGGEQKMLILSRALMLKPSLLFIDEISEGLQPSVVSKIGEVLAHERDDNGTTIVLVEQNLNFALSVADRWAVLKLGAIDDQDVNGPGTRERVLQHLKI